MDIPFRLLPTSTLLSTFRARVKRRNFRSKLLYVGLSCYVLDKPVFLPLIVNRPFITLFYTLSGSIKGTVRNQRRADFTVIDKQRYSAIFIPSGEYELMIPNGKNHYCYFIFEELLFDSLTQKNSALNSMNQYVIQNSTEHALLSIQNITEEISPLLKKIGNLNTNQHNWINDKLDLVSQLTEIYSKQILPNFPSQKPEEIVTDIRKSLLYQIRQGKKPALADLVNNYPISHRTFFNHFKQNHGISPKDFIQQERMKFAHELLVKERMTVKDVAYYLGYIAISNFTIQFKKHFGKPPSQADSIGQ